jgi:biopolymer transport protein ExbB
LSRDRIRRAIGLIAVLATVGLGASSAVGGALAPEEADAELQVTYVEPPTPVAGREVELLVFGEGFLAEEKNIQVTVTTGGKEVQAQSVRLQSPRRLKVTLPGETQVGRATVTVTVTTEATEEEEAQTRTARLEDAVYFRRADERFGLQTMLFKMRHDWRGFMEWFKLGGGVMYLLAAISFFGVAWALHCLLVLRRSQVMPKKFLDVLVSRLSQGDLQGAASACRKSKSAFGRVILGGLRKSTEPAEKIREAVADAGAREAAHLHQKIRYLANIGTITPMLGLLGTVLGMIMAFNIIASGDVRHYQLAAAIAKAMVTTATGLVIGIPAMALYFYLRGRLLRLTTEMEDAADGLAQGIIEKGGAG